MSDTSFKGSIIVPSRIVDALSSGLYESPAACLKELVNNAYDADARNVQIYVKPDAEEVVIADDGCGLDRAEFERHFKRISESHKRDDGQRTLETNRLKVGKIGIGFVAANELCDEMEIESTKKGSASLLKVAIDFRILREEVPDERRTGKESIRKGHYFGHEEQIDRDEHFTRVFLRYIRSNAHEDLISAKRVNLDGSAGTIYGRDPEAVSELLGSSSLKSWTDLDRYSQTYLGIALNVPVPYAPGWVAPPYRRKLDDFVKETAELDFNVVYDGTVMLKPIVFPKCDETLLRRFSYEGRHVSAKGYFYAMHGALRPRELQGVLLRIRNAAVGGYSSSFLEYPLAESQLLRNWISGEIWASDGLEPAMNIDRKTLRLTHPAYVELRGAFHRWFAGYLLEVRKQLYARSSGQRRLGSARDEAQRISHALLSAHVRGEVADEVLNAWPPPDSSEDRRSMRRLTHKYSLGELYEVVLEVASRHMNKEEFERFVAELTRRLGD